MQKNPYQAYHNASYTAPKTRQVVMLYDGVIRHLGQARQAMLNGDIEVRYHKLVRASEIIAGLQMSLDFENGQDTAQMLYDLYSSLESRIMELHRTGAVALCDQIITEIKEIREVWYRIDVGDINPDGTVGTGASARQAQEQASEPSVAGATAPRASVSYQAPANEFASTATA